MAGPDDLDPGPDADPVVRAGEYVLGVLDDAERAAARHAILADAEFADAVRWWEQRLGALAQNAGEVEPSDTVWPAIAARLGDDDASATVTPLRRPSRPLLAFAMLASAGIAAVVTLFLTGPATRPPATVPVEATAPAQLFAALRGETPDQQLSARIDPDARRLTLRVAGLSSADPATRSAELWVVPEGGAPISLGLIPGSGDFGRRLTAAEADLLVEGATLAVTIEERAGAPHAAPTTPILVAGSLTRL